MPMYECRLLNGAVRSARPANIPTLFTNAAAAWAAVAGGEWPPPGIYLGVVLTGLFFYLYGMWENDRVDARWDASRYPDRPVPCGAVSPSFLRAIALMAGLAGLVLNMLLGGEFAVGGLLLIVISLYN
ncbi:MAG: UbiA family prenyltransferase, partial [Akkermansia sp.]